MKVGLRLILASFAGAPGLRTMPPMRKENGPKPTIIQSEMAQPLHPILDLDGEEIGFLFWHDERLFCFDAAPGPALLLTREASANNEFPLDCPEFNINVYGRFEREGDLIFKLRSRFITFARAPIQANPTLWPVWEVGERVEDYRLVGLVETPIETAR